MKSVLQQKSNLLDSTQNTNNGTVRRFTLLCCALFFIGQLSFLISPNGQSSAGNFHLQTTTPEHLDFTKKPVNASSINANLTPFFFEPVPINICDKTLLLSVRGIGPALADNIISTRTTIGVFKNKNDLLRVSGIGESRMNRFAESLSFAINR